ncbi:hypothetical protein [Haloferax sp. DFSO60]|uniref:DUF7096 domain-containing protein n=1 Tax=Haloferax sp. DFSO60 TaxID=3388652 RepID=UPI00397E8469
MSRRIVALLVATLVVVSMGAPLALAAPAGPANTAIAPSGSVAPQVAANNSTTTESPTNDTANATPPGQKLAGVIGVQGSETNGEIERRSFDRRFENANSNASKAAVVAGQLQSASVRLETLEERQERLETLYEQGNISEARYRVQMTRIVADLEQTKAILNRTESAATTVPESDLRERGVNTTELEDLRTRANNLTGPEVSAIARDLTGDAPGKGLGREDSEDDERNETSTARGDGADSERERGNGSDNASDRRPSDGGSDNSKSANDNANRGQQAKDADGTTVTTDSDDTSDSSGTTDDETTTTTTTTSDSSQDGDDTATTDS